MYFVIGLDIPRKQWQHCRSINAFSQTYGKAGKFIAVFAVFQRKDQIRFIASDVQQVEGTVYAVPEDVFLKTMADFVRCHWDAVNIDCMQDNEALIKSKGRNVNNYRDMKDWLDEQRDELHM